MDNQAQAFAMETLMKVKNALRKMSIYTGISVLLITSGISLAITLQIELLLFATIIIVIFFTNLFLKEVDNLSSFLQNRIQTDYSHVLPLIRKALEWLTTMTFSITLFGTFFFIAIGTNFIPGNIITLIAIIICSAIYIKKSREVISLVEGIA